MVQLRGDTSGDLKQKQQQLDQYEFQIKTQQKVINNNKLKKQKTIDDFKQSQLEIKKKEDDLKEAEEKINDRDVQLISQKSQVEDLLDQLGRKGQDTQSLMLQIESLEQELKTVREQYQMSELQHNQAMKNLDQQQASETSVDSYDRMNAVSQRPSGYLQTKLSIRQDSFGMLNESVELQSEQKVAMLEEYIKEQESQQASKNEQVEKDRRLLDQQV